MTSIRRRLLAGLLAVVLCAGLIAALGVYFQARREANELFDYQLRQMALSLRDQTFNPFAAAEPPELGESFDFVIQVWGRDGVRLYYSHPDLSLPNRARLGYETVGTPEGRWRVFSVQQRGLTFQVAQPMSVRNELAATAALRTLAPFLLLLPVLGLLVWFTVGRGLRPLEAMARAVKTRTPAALHPLPDNGAPEEIRPLVESLNDLLRRLDRTLAAQRNFVADAAHELRAPLTALRLQIQLAERAVTADERAAAFATVKEGLTRAAHLVDQLLTLARQEPEVAERPVEAVDLSDLARQIIAEHMLLAASKSIDLGMARSEAVAIGDRHQFTNLQPHRRLPGTVVRDSDQRRGQSREPAGAIRQGQPRPYRRDDTGGESGARQFVRHERAGGRAGEFGGEGRPGGQSGRGTRRCNPQGQRPGDFEFRRSAAVCGQSQTRRHCQTRSVAQGRDAGIDRRGGRDEDHQSRRITVGGSARQAGAGGASAGSRRAEAGGRAWRTAGGGRGRPRRQGRHTAGRHHILSLNGTPVKSADELRGLVERAGKKTIALLVQREDTKIFVPLELG